MKASRWAAVGFLGLGIGQNLEGKGGGAGSRSRDHKTESTVDPSACTVARFRGGLLGNAVDQPGLCHPLWLEARPRVVPIVLNFPVTHPEL
jgi:hypothetical protein